MPLAFTTNLNTILGGTGNRSLRVVSIAFDSSYPTGGEPFAPADIGFLTFDFVYAESAVGYIFRYDYTANTLLAYYQNVVAGADSALIQVAATTDLSAVTGVRTLIIGQNR